MDKNQIALNLLEQDPILNLNFMGRMKFSNSYNLEVTPEGDVVLLKSDFWHVLFSQNDESALRMLRGLQPETEIGFSGVAEKYYHIAKDIYPIKWEEFCHLYYLSEDSLDTSMINHNVDSLTLADAPIVNEFYTYKGEGSLHYIEDCIKNRPSSVIRNEHGEPISWALVREDGSLGIMYTLKEHRQKGYAVSVSVDLAKKAFNIGLTPYVHIVKGNTASIRLAESIGFKYHTDIVWFGI